MSGNCGNKRPCDCGCNCGCGCNNNECTIKNLSGLKQQYDCLNEDYAKYLNEAICANNRLLAAMEMLVKVDCAQGEIVDEITELIGECLDRYDANKCGKIAQKLAETDRCIQELYTQIFRVAEAGNELLEKTDCVSNKYDNILDHVVGCVAHGLDDDDCNCCHR